MLERLLKRLVAKLPSRTIVTDGRPYLTRWYLWPRGPRTGGKTGDDATPASPFAVFIHFFHRGDEDRDQHNHPWDVSASLILTGGYREERGESVRVIKPGMINVLYKDTFHRVDLLQPKKGCWTIFVAGHNIQNWGFKDRETGKFIPWQKYVAN